MHILGELLQSAFSIPPAGYFRGVNSLSVTAFGYARPLQAGVLNA